MNGPSPAWGLARFGWGVRRLCREPITIEDAREGIRRRTRDRDGTVRALVRPVYASGARNPNQRLMRAAGCAAGDVERLVAPDGVPGALGQWRPGNLLEVRRARPRGTDRGKVPAFRSRSWR